MKEKLNQQLSTQCQPILEDPIVIKTTQMLEMQNNGYNFQKLLVRITQLETLLESAQSEISSMQKELSQSTPEAINQAVNSAINNTENYSKMLELLKDKIREVCQKALEVCKETGIIALNKTAEFLHIRPMFEKLLDNTETMIRANEKAIEKIENFANEYHNTGMHLKNMGRALAGKETADEVKPVGKLAKTIEAPYKAELRCWNGAKSAIEQALVNITGLEKTASNLKSQEAVPIQEDELEM